MSALSSCSLFTDEDPKKNSYQPLWEYNFDIGYFSSIDPILHNNKVIYSALDEKKNDFSANSTLEAFDKEEGKMIWRWDKTIDDSYDQFYFESEYYLNDNILYISTGIDYAIDLQQGNTVHYLDQPKIGGQGFFGKDDFIFSTFDTQNDEKSTMKYTKN